MLSSRSNRLFPVQPWGWKGSLSLSSLASAVSGSYGEKSVVQKDPLCYLLVSLEVRKHFPVLNTNLKPAVKKQNLKLILSFQYLNVAYKIHNLHKKEGVTF